jgi:exo-beta-1,3-glucanase (GH17 family)
VDSSYQQVVNGAPGKEVIIDTGGPTAGDQKGAAVPSQANANYFLANFMAWANARQVPYFYFEAFDEPWKAKHEGPVGSHWGLWDANGQMKPGAQGILGNPR